MGESVTKLWIVLWITLCIIKLCQMSDSNSNTLSQSKMAENKTSYLGGDYCRKGQYAVVSPRGKVACIACPENTFMDVDKHSYLECRVCTKFDDHITSEIKISNCTSDSDTVIECADKHFKDLHSQCSLCRNCTTDTENRFVSSPCTKDSDTICCPHQGMRVEWDDGGHSYKCVSVSTFLSTTASLNLNCEGSVNRANGCLAGERVVSDCHHEVPWFSCKSCGSDTFMNLSRHTHKICVPCSPPKNDDLQVVFHCNTTHDNVYTKQATPQSNGLLSSEIIIAIVVLIFCIFCVLFCVFAYHKGWIDRKRVARRFKKLLPTERRYKEEQINMDEYRTSAAIDESSSCDSDG